MSSNAEQPLVSIGLPAYDRPKLLRRAIGSLTGQSYKNLELIISDDCSPGDGTRKVVQEYMQEDPRIRYYRQERNIGAVANHKFTLTKARGKYFMWASEDDEWEPSFIETGVKALSDNSFYQAWLCSFDVTDTLGRVIMELPSLSYFSCTPDRRKNLTKYLRASGNLGLDCITHGIYETSVLADTVEIYALNNNYGTDSAFNTAFLARHNILIIDEVLFHKSVTRRSLTYDKDIVIPFENESYREVNRKRGTYNPKRAVSFFREHYRAVRGTPYTRTVMFTLILITPAAIKNFLAVRAIRKSKSVAKRVKAVVGYLLRRP